MAARLSGKLHCLRSDRAGNDVTNHASWHRVARSFCKKLRGLERFPFSLAHSRMS
jgi:hypothetical protein